jgi:RNA polymerase sigma factor for flagellar operon FliA
MFCFGSEHGRHFMTAAEQQRNQLAKTLIPLVHEVAARIARRLPSYVRMEDLVGAGMLGLASALSRYDHRRAETFRSYAEFRIRGEIIDELRRRDLLTRDAREGHKRLQRASSAVAQQLGREPDDDQVAEHLEMPLHAYHALQQRCVNARFVPADDVELSDETTPADLIARREALANLVAAIEKLPERSRLALWLYYVEELPLREIGELLGVTPSRVCQLRTEAVQRLRRTTMPLAA